MNHDGSSLSVSRDRLDRVLDGYQIGFAGRVGRRSDTYEHGVCFPDDLRGIIGSAQSPGIKSLAYEGFETLFEERQLAAPE